MSNRAIVMVGTSHHARGVNRLQQQPWVEDMVVSWTSNLPPGCPAHDVVPYAFKAYALQHVAQKTNFTTLLWCDSCMVPVRDMEPLWKRIEEYGYWFCYNGYPNGQWCTDEALDIFGITREEAFKQKHVVAGIFGLDLTKDIGRAFLKEYYRLAATTRAFIGPWTNVKGEASSDRRVSGHRHDQTAASHIAHQLGMELTEAPEYFAYYQQWINEGKPEKTIVVADGDLNRRY